MCIRPILFLGLLLFALPAHAKTRDYCPDRPGISTPACTMEDGRASLELAPLDLTLDRDETSRQSTAQVAGVLLRRGIADHAEVQLGWAGFGFHRERDRATGKLEHRSGSGDLTLSLRRNLQNPDGSGLSLAVMPFVTLPVGRIPIGDGEWNAGVRLPVSYKLSDRLTIVTTSEIDAAADQDGHGRHLALDEVVGVAIALTERLTATTEYGIIADHDPQGHQLQNIAGLSFGWMPADDLQFDVGANGALDRNSPDFEIYVGISRRF